MLLIHPVREAARALPALLGLLVAGSSAGIGPLLAVLGLGVVGAYSVLRWMTTRYRITTEQVQLQTGLLQRRSTATPAARVRTVDVTASALHRVLGLAKVQIGTGGKESGLTLDSLTAAEATALRAELLHRAQAATPSGPRRAADEAADSGPGAARVASGGPPGAADAGEPGARGERAAYGSVLEQEAELLAFDPAWVRFAPFTLTGLLAALAVVGAGWQLAQQVLGDEAEIGVVTSAARWLGRQELWLAIMLAASGVLAFVTLLAVGGYVLANWGFRVSRHAGGTLHVSRGLLTTRATSLEERRLRGVELNDGILLRIPRGARVEAVMTGLSGSGSETGKVLAPPAPLDVATRLASSVLGAAGPLSAELTPHGPAARRRRYLRAMVSWLLLLTAAFVPVQLGIVPAWVLALPGALLPGVLWLAADRYRSLGHGLADGYLVSRGGSLARSRAMLAVDGVIGWNFSQSFFQRRAGLCTLVATTAAGDQAYPVVDLPAAQAVRLAGAATPGLLEQFAKR